MFKDDHIENEKPQSLADGEPVQYVPPTPRPRSRRNFRHLYEHEFDTVVGGQTLTPLQLWAMAREYFRWCEENPIIAPEAATFQGTIYNAEIMKIRPFTFKGLLRFLCLSQTGYFNLRKNPEHRRVTDAIDDIIRDQKYNGAVTGLFNAAIVGRDLGIGAEQDADKGGADGEKDQALTADNVNDVVKSIVGKLL